MTTVRDAIVQTIAANTEHIESRMADFWRGWAEDLIRAGVDRREVVETMVSVAHVQAMKIHGSTYMAQSLRSCAEAFEFAARHGVEYPATEH